MNKNLYRAFALFSAAATLSLASCDDIDHNSAPGQDSPIAFSPSIGEQGAATRAVDGTWTGGETVGIAMLASGDPVTSSAIFHRYNVSAAGATSALTPADEEQTLYYPGSGDDVNFAAFSPYTAITGTSVSYSAFADQSKQTAMEAVDFLYHKGTTDYNKTSTDAVTLDFAHQLSKVVIRIAVDPSAADDIDLAGLTGVTLSHLPASVTIDLADASLTAGTEAVTAVMCKKSGVYEYEAIVVPHEGGTGNFNARELTISHATAGDFTHTLSDDLDFASGNIYTLPFRLTQVGLEQVSEATITDWSTGTITWDTYTLSSTDDSFDIAKEGETKTFSFTTTYPGDQVSASVSYTDGSDWVTITDDNPVKGSIVDGEVNYTCEFTVIKNPMGIAAREATITIKVDQVEKTFTVSQAAGEAIPFESASNSYILSPTGTAIYIPVSRANEHATLSGDATAAIGASDALTAEFLWADNSTLLTALEVVGIGSTGAIKVTSNSSGKEGNAIIAVKVGDVIKWSWHIWVTSYAPSGTWMDRNLGATSATKSSTMSTRVKTFGLMYQWGRKDPFPGSAGDASGVEPTIYSSLSDASGAQYVIDNATTTEQTISWTIANPESFIAKSDSWMSGSTTSDTNWNTSDNKKTIYDPCPAGYRVPVNGSWGAAESAWSSFAWSDTYKGRDTGSTYGGWYPAAGRRVNSAGALNNVDTSGFYWSATASNERHSYNLNFGNGGVTPSTYNSRAFGYGVRCEVE